MSPILGRMMKIKLKLAAAVGATVLAACLTTGAGQATAAPAAAGPIGTQDFSEVCLFNWDNREECFWVGTATTLSIPGAVYHQWQFADGSWSGPASLGGKATSGIDGARNADGRLEIFVRGNDGALWHMWQLSKGGSWSGWASLGGNIAFGPGSTGPFVYVIDGRIYVDVYGPDNLWHTKFQTALNCCWSGWV
jgi:hypothetical protein